MPGIKAVVAVDLFGLPADFDEKANSKMKVTSVKGRRGYYNFGFNYGYFAYFTCPFWSHGRVGYFKK